MHLQVAAGIVLLIAAREAAIEFVNVLMRFFVVSQYPQLSIRVCAARITAAELVDRVLAVRRQVVLQMLRHLERLVAAFERAHVEAHLQVRLEMLLLFRVLCEHFRAAMHGAVNVITALLSVVIEHSIIFL